MSDTVWKVAELTLAVIREADPAKKKDLADQLISMRVRSVFEQERKLKELGISFV